MSAAVAIPCAVGVSTFSFTVRVARTTGGVRATRTLERQALRRPTKRTRAPIETPQYAAMMRRMLRSWARRVGSGDTVDLEELVAFRDRLEEAIQIAIDVGREMSPEAWSWSQIGLAVGTKKSAAQERYGPRRAETVVAS